MDLGGHHYRFWLSKLIRGTLWRAGLLNPYTLQSDFSEPLINLDVDNQHS